MTEDIPPPIMPAHRENRGQLPLLDGDLAATMLLSPPIKEKLPATRAHLFGGMTGRAL